MQFSICRCFPRAYQRKCLPKSIFFDETDDEPQWDWDDLILNRISIYCNIVGRLDPNWEMLSITTLEAINQLLMSLDYNMLNVEIKAVDSWASYKNRVLACVTKSKVDRDNNNVNVGGIHETQTGFHDTRPHNRSYWPGFHPDIPFTINICSINSWPIDVSISHVFLIWCIDLSSIHIHWVHLMTHIFNSIFVINYGGPKMTSVIGVFYELERGTLNTTPFHINDAKNRGVSDTIYLLDSDNRDYVATTSMFSAHTTDSPSSLFKSMRLSTPCLCAAPIPCCHANRSVSPLHPLSLLPIYLSCWLHNFTWCQNM